MAPSNNDCTAFRQGTHVAFRTVHNVKVEGHVVCFDPALKVLVVRCKDESTGKYLVRIFNLSMIKDTITTDSPNTAESIESLLSLCNVNPKKAQERVASLVATRRQEIMPDDSVSVEGQQTFLQLKRIVPDTRWDGPNIRVFGWVIVRSPYDKDSAEILQSEIHNDSDKTKAQTALSQVKKTLAKSFTPDDRFRADFYAPFPVDDLSKNTIIAAP